MTEGQRQSAEVNYAVNVLLCGKKYEKLTCEKSLTNRDTIYTRTQPT